MLQSFLAVTLVVDLFIGGGLSQQCYSQPNCVLGSEIDTQTDPPTPKDCCAGTNDGQSYADLDGVCSVQQCVVHGFAQASYNVEEGERLDTTFGLNVKNTTSLPVLLILGTITSEAGTARYTDFENLQPISFEGSTDIRLFTTNDEITLEYDDTVILRFRPEFIINVEGIGEFIRDTAIVNIIDNDRLEINIEEAEYSIPEDAANNPVIRLQFRRTQSPFTLTITPASINNLDLFDFNAGNFIYIPTIPETIATPADDFAAESFTITIPATEDRPPGSIFEDIQQDATVPRFRVINDTVNEIEQSFALVAVIGDDVPDDFACFQRQVGDTECFGRAGATEMKIVDNDAMIIGFSQRRQSVSESDAPMGDITIFLDVHSLRISEIQYEAQFRALETANATVEAINLQFSDRFDALFGTRDTEQQPIVENRELNPGSLRLERLPTIILNDFASEGTECYEIRILSPDVPGREIFTCNADEDVPPAEDFFCVHTICIDDDDEPFQVAYVETTYTVIESEGQVEVCVNLTRPDMDILDETVRVETINDPTSVFIPPGSVLATPDSPNFLGMYPMDPGTDYEEQIRGINRIRDIVINATRRIICYNQIIYDDIRLEMSEYAGLTLAVRDSSVRTEVHPIYDQVAIQILDDDNAVVGLEETFYQVSEDVGVVEVCAIVYSPNIPCPIEFPFNVNLTTSDGTAVASMDYEPLSTLLMFDTCNTRQCTDITIKNDAVLENIESFFVNLLRAPDLDPRITLDPVLAEIEITDNDDAVVGLQRTFYQVSEDVGVVEVCAIVYRPDGNIPCPIDFAFDVSLSTSDDSAVSPFDYIAVDTILMFDACQMRSCVCVSIRDDVILENVESFDLTLERTPDLDSRITLDPVNGVVEIIDNGAQPESVTIHPVSATAVRIRWSGHQYRLTTLIYTSYFTATGAMMSHYMTVLPPDVTATEVSLDDAVEGYEHNFTLYYNTSCDDTTAPVTLATFAFDKKYFQIQFGPIDYCLNWGIEKTGRLEAQVQSHITRIIRERCTDCYEFTEAYLRRGLFLCYGNPTTVTYRSTLVKAFPTKNSTQLVGIIQSWVSTSPSFTLNGLLVRVNANCSTCVASLGDDECVSEDTVLSDSVAARVSQVLSVCAVRELGKQICTT